MSDQPSDFPNRGRDFPADRAQGVHANLAELARALAPKLNSDELAKLNACVTDLQSLASTAGNPEAPTHAPMAPPYPTVENPPAREAEEGTEPPPAA